MSLFQRIVLPCLGITMVTAVQAEEVWTSTFDNDADGVVDVLDLNPTKEMIGPVVDGRLTITTVSEDANLSPPDSYPYKPDKAGRPLGRTLTKDDAFSARFRFKWDPLWGDKVTQDIGSNWEFVGFIGESSNYQNRQAVGVVLRHWQLTNGNYFLRFGTTVGDNSDEQRNLDEVSVSLDFKAPQREFEIVMSWDPDSDALTAGIYNPQTGAAIREVTNIILNPAAINNLQLTHLGWSDYTTCCAPGIQTNVWQVDEMTFFDKKNEGFPELAPKKSWTSNFDSGIDGLETLFDDNNLRKEIIGPNLGGSLTLRLSDETDDFGPPIAYPFFPDKAGRPLGTPITLLNDSFFGECYFSWSDIWSDPIEQSASSARHYFGFMGDANPQTRQVCGAIIRQWQIANGNYYLRLGTIVGGPGDVSDVDEQITENQNSRGIGPNPLGDIFHITVEWDHLTHTMTAQLFNEVGTLLVSQSDVVTSSGILVAQTMTHLGWSDYTSRDDETKEFEIQAHELSYTVLGDVPGDINGDGVVNALDVDLSFNCYGGPYYPNPGCPLSDYPIADINGDGDVDVADYYWMAYLVSE